MSSTYLGLHYHFIFGTKDRAPSIDARWRSRFREYLGGTIRGLGGFPEGVGGTADHVHLLVGLKSTHCLADVVRELKRPPRPGFIKKSEIGDRSFEWQEGYAAFSVSTPVREAVRKYVSNQEEHHRLKSFREEFVEFLVKAGIGWWVPPAPRPVEPPGREVTRPLWVRNGQEDDLRVLVFFPVGRSYEFYDTQALIAAETFHL